MLNLSNKPNISSQLFLNDSRTFKNICLSKFLIENKIPLILEKPAADKLNEIKKLIKISSKNKAVMHCRHLRSH